MLNGTINTDWLCSVYKELEITTETN